MKKQSAVPPLWDPLFWSQFSCYKSEYFRQNTPTCFYAQSSTPMHTVLHLSKLQASHGCHQSVCAMKLFPRPAYESPTKCCNQGGSSSSEVNTMTTVFSSCDLWPHFPIYSVQTPVIRLRSHTRLKRTALEIIFKR